MKLLVLVILALPAASFATDIPQTAKIIYQVTATNSDPDQMFHGIQENESKVDVELQCKTLFYKWDTASSGYCDVRAGWGHGAVACANPFNHVFGGTHYVSQKTLTMNAYCDPRGFDEKVLISLQRNCEIKPELNCLDDKVRTALRGLNVTQRIEIGRPN